jgi:hypothetical protein
LNRARGFQVAKKSKKPRDLPLTGVVEIDNLPQLARCGIQDYVRAASAYVCKSSNLEDGPKKAAQIRLSNALGRVLEADLKEQLPTLFAQVGERQVAGALRTVKADVSEFHDLDGLRLAIEIKPINLAVGRAIWNRFGDIRTFAVNLHLKFPFAVVGGVLVLPTSEEIGTKEAEAAATTETEVSDGGTDDLSRVEEPRPTEVGASFSRPLVAPRMKSTRHLIERAVQRLVRAGGRKSEGDAPHLLEAIAVVVYDPTSGALDSDLPPDGSGLRWNEFVSALAAAYKGRFEDWSRRHMASEGIAFGFGYDWLAPDPARKYVIAMARQNRAISLAHRTSLLG